MGMFGKTQSQMTQIVNSLQVPDSCYGQCVPYAFGHPRLPQKLIYWSNLQNQTAGGKKGGKSGAVTYTVNADMLFGYGPFEGIAAIWQNQCWWYVNYSSQTFTGSGSGTSFTFAVSNNSSTLVMIMGVQYVTSYSESYSDYGGFGITRSFTLAGTTNVPLYNNAFPAPNFGTWANANQPYATYNVTYGSDSVTVHFPSSVTAPTVTVYYCEVGGEDQPPQANGGKKGGGGVPISQPGLTFERELGVGPSGNPQTFPEFSGCGGANIPLGSSPELPFLNFEVKALFSLGNTAPASSFNNSTGGYTAATTSGDCNPADVILDIITSGNRVDVLTGGTAMIWQHGLGFTAAVPGSTGNAKYMYSRYGCILADESTLWSGGSNLGLNAIRNYCLAYNIFISGTLDSQTSATDFLNQLCRVANCAAVWDGAALNFIPYCEVSTYGNGASYVAPTASGPVLSLSTLTSNHFLPQQDKSPVEWDRDRPSPNFNSLQIGFRDATQQYNSNYVIIADTADIAVQGAMPGSQENHDYITNSQTAQNIGWALLRRQVTVDRQDHKFSLPAYFETMLTPMDLINLYDPDHSPFPVPVRIKTIDISMTLEGKRQMELTVEPFMYGASVPIAPPSTGGPGGGTNPGGGNQQPGNINPPIIIETVPGLNVAGPQIWIGVSGSAPGYGGCAIWLSTDGGASYGPNPIGLVIGRQTMGALTATYPISLVNPDASDTLAFSLAESLGSITAVNAAGQAAYNSLCVLTNESPARISYLKDGLVFKMNLPQEYIGATLYFKFTAFNQTGGQQQQLSSVSPYTFTPTGLVGWTYAPGATSPTPNPYAGALEMVTTGTYPTAGAVIASYTFSASTFLPQNLVYSIGFCTAAPTGSVSMPIVRVVGGTPTTVGSINFAAGATTPTFTFSSGVVFSSGDMIEVEAPTPVDATFAGANITFWTVPTT